MSTSSGTAFHIFLLNTNDSLATNFGLPGLAALPISSHRLFHCWPLTEFHCILVRMSPSVTARLESEKELREDAHGS